MGLRHREFQVSALNYSVHGKAPAVKLTGTVSQSDVDSEFSVQVPLEIESWFRATGEMGADIGLTRPVYDSLNQAPTKVFTRHFECAGGAKVNRCFTP